MDPIQIAILALSGLALLCTQIKSMERMGPIVGLISQPFWIYATLVAGQLGMFVNSIIVTVIWFIGLYRHWFKK